MDQRSAGSELTNEYRAQFLLEISKAVNSHLDVFGVLDELKALLQSRIHFQAIVIHIIQGDQLRMHSASLTGLTRHEGESVDHLLERSRLQREIELGIPLPPRKSVSIPLKGTWVELFRKSRQAHVKSNIAPPFLSPHEENMFRYGIHSYVSIPLLRNEELIGAVNFASFENRTYEPEEIQLLEEATLIVSIAVSNALAYEELERYQKRLEGENRLLQDEVIQSSRIERVIGDSLAIHHVRSSIEKVAPTSSTVLISGETGTGKELIAREIHRHSQRATRSMISINCAALPSDLIASELFGHERGAFTGATQQRIGRFELAHGGTLFLDEIGELTADMQVALLRVLQEGEFERVGGERLIEVDVRIIAATNRDLEQRVNEQLFRSDLYYRLNVFPITIPPLRERKDDIPLLVDYFIHRLARQLGKQIDRVDRQSMEALTEYSWPGNIRELQNILERAIILADGPLLRIDQSQLTTRLGEGQSFLTLREEEKHHRSVIEDALRQSRGRVSGPRGAAMALGIPASTLESRIRAFRINKHMFRQN